MSFKFLEYKNDCFFIGDPLRKKYDFEVLNCAILCDLEKLRSWDLDCVKSKKQKSEWSEML